MYLKDSSMPIDLLLKSDECLVVECEEYVSVMKQHPEMAKMVVTENIKSSQDYYKLNYDKKSNTFHFHKEDRVLVYTPKPRKGISPKLQRLYNGPYIVLEIIAPNLKISKPRRGENSHQIVHANRCHLVSRENLLSDQLYELPVEPIT